uniref:Uncharacterized protein n=1 Tax=Solibacter usitatus (strain Ellin6076) TaxID=234267 RepID=Q022R2_SOLUE
MPRIDVNKKLAEALDSPDFRRALLQVAHQKSTRPVRTGHCVVVEIPEAAQPHDFSPIAPGTVTAFVAREGEPLLHNLTDAIAGNNSMAFNAATDQIQQMAAELSRKLAGAPPYTDAQRQAFPSFAEISYANKALTSQVYVDNLLPVHVHTFPYNGGQLDSKSFSMMEYYRADVHSPLTCLLIIRRPKLGEIEREALRLVPSGSTANNIGAAVVAPVTPALMAFMVIAAEAAARFLYNELVNLWLAFLYGPTTALSIPDAVLKGEQFQKMLKSLPPEVTAAELLRLRADILVQGPSK